MCNICQRLKNQAQGRLFIKCPQQELSDDSVESSFSEISNDLKLCETHSRKVRNTFKSPQLYRKPNHFEKQYLDNTRLQRNPSQMVYHKVQNPNGHNYYQQNYMKDEIRSLRIALADKDHKISELLLLNRQLEAQLNSLNSIGKYKAQDYRIASDTETKNYHKKIQKLEAEIDKLKSEMNRFRKIEERKQNTQTLGRMANLEKQLQTAHKEIDELHNDKIEPKQGNSLRWKDNFIQAFLHLMQKISDKQKFNLTKVQSQKRKTKIAWRILKNTVYNLRKNS